MNGLYINTYPPTLSHSHKRLDLTIEPWANDITNISVVYRESKVESLHQYEDQDIRVTVTGLFFIGDKLNPITELASTLKTAGIDGCHQIIEYGVFTAVAVFKKQRLLVIFTDPLGLAANFYSFTNGVTVTPSPSLIQSNTSSHFDSFLTHQKHLIGKYTSKQDVYRLLPFEQLDLTTKTVKTSKSWLRKDFDLTRIKDDLNDLAHALSNKKLCVALSSGFDSRLLAAVFRPALSYCWGPQQSRDIIVSKEISDILNIEITTFPLPTSPTPQDRYLYQLYCQDNCIQNIRVFSGYHSAHQTTKYSDVCLDGYLGDVFQRGTYFFGKGLAAEARKLIPAFNRLSTPTTLLKSRYRKIWKNQALRATLLQEYNNFLSTHNLPNTISSVVAFDYLWGRGLRLIGTGGPGANSYYNQVITPLSSPRIVTCLLKTSPEYFYRLHIFKEIWQAVEVDEAITRIKSEHYFSPKTPRSLIYVISLVGRILVNFVPGFGNYGR